MRIKIADTWYEAKLGQPIMIELSEKDKENISNMVEGATKYAIFDDKEQMTVEQKFEWMK